MRGRGGGLWERASWRRARHVELSAAGTDFIEGGYNGGLLTYNTNVWKWRKEVAGNMKRNGYIDIIDGVDVLD